MRIQTVHIKNFRTLKDVTVDFDSVTSLIGPNGSGKSSVLRALDWFFNGKIGVLTDQDCSHGATDEDIEVQVTFADLTERDRQELGKYAVDGVNFFTAWKRRSADGSESLSANAKGLEEFIPIKAAASATEKKTLYAELRSDRADLDLPQASTGTAVDQAITVWEAEHRDLLTEVPEALQTNFFGFNSGGKMSGLFDFVLVTADLRAGEESTDGRSSIIGRILERSVDRTAADERIAKLVEESRAKQEQIYGEMFKDQLESMATALNAVVSSYSPGRVVAITPAGVDLKAPRTTFDVSVLDGVTQTAVERQGHGFQRTLLISALQHLAQSGSASTDGVICLAIEEPELFQHPIQAQTFAKVLRTLAEDPEMRIQVAYATHSPYFVEARHFEQVRRLTRSTDEPPVVSVHSSTIDAVTTRLGGAIDDRMVARQLDSIVANQLSVALFANRVLIVEGETDASVLAGVGDRRASGRLEAHGVSIVAARSKRNIPLAHAILTTLGIPTYTLFDGDSGGEIRAQKSGQTEAKIAAVVKQVATENRWLLRYLGEPEADYPAEGAGPVVAVFGDRLEDFLQTQWPEWADACAALEDATGVDLTKNSHAYRAATLAAGGDVPPLLTEILERTEGV